ncbi:MAG TPA: prepilin-type N-terminal cleavage/methylation domain-containing protein [Gemmatimonadales bacterium]|jgi:prepilin-type N-terminal cleavage/methylation domain-containing protein|nr:prepilin-type N-terminal cleavage/methylation domain-containing protein [Gemmatimonadales bacterium]
MTMRALPSRQTGGFTLVEVMVSMTLLSMAALALGSMLLRAASQARTASAAAYQTAELSAEVSRLGAVPFDALVIGTTCADLSLPPSTRCATINSLSPKVKQVTVVIAPSDSALLQPLATTFNRTISGNGNPLKTQ